MSWFSKSYTADDAAAFYERGAKIEEKVGKAQRAAGASKAAGRSERAAKASRDEAADIRRGR